MRSTRAFYAFTAFTQLGMGAICASYVLFLLDIGLGYSQVALINVVYFILTVIFELPTGMIADGRGRGYSVMWGSALMALSGIVYFFAGNVWHALLGEAIGALATAFFSGALSAWIADAPDRKEPLGRVYANKTIVQALSIAVGSLLGVWTFEHTGGRAFIWALHAFWYIGAFVFAFVFMRGKEAERQINEWEALRLAIGHMRGSRTMLWALCVQACMGLFAAYNLYWPVLLQMQYSQKAIGWVWILMYCSTMGAGYFARRKQESEDVGERNHLAERILRSLALVALAMSAVVFTNTGWIWIALITLHEFGRGVFSPALETYVQERVEGDYRATYGSLQNIASLVGTALCEAILAIAFAILGSDPALIPWIWLFNSMALLAVVVILWRVRPRA